MFLTASQARSMTRQSWTTKEREKYSKLLDLVEKKIEESASNGNLSAKFPFENEDDITQARMLAAEFMAEGFGVKLLYFGHRDITQGTQTDLRPDCLKIYWGDDLQDD